MNKKKYFFGWNNIKWAIKEVVNIYSSKKSFFSKKRIESGIAFVIAQWGMIFFLLENINKMSTSDLFIWAGIEFAVSGYIINQIQKEKKQEESEKENPEL
jgi:ascorbate-specific PTS system EIIC-type component UlaA